MTKDTDSREIVLDVLMEILEHSAYSHLILRQALNKYQYLDKAERSFITRTVEGTVEYLIQIDYVIDFFSSTKVKKIKPVIRSILRMSVYQILYMDRVPDSAVCNEAVKLAAKRKFVGLKGFVNGVLRNISRNKETLVWPDDSVRYSVPAWIVSMWNQDYGTENANTVMASFLENSKTIVRLNRSKAGKDEILSSLRNQNVQVAESGISEDMVILEKFDYMEGLEAFQKGYIQVQDISSALVGEAADPKEGDFCIDVCGAPGGKSIHLADKLNGTGMVEVRDLTEFKVSLIQENIDRCGFDNIRAKVWDALVPDSDSVGKADIVLADLPCSGLGILGRKPDIKYRVKPENLDELASLQREILSVVQTYVKPGGRLIFSTCTIDKKENEENFAWFLENFPFQVVDLEEKFKDQFQIDTLKHGYMQLLPGIHPCDGFFIGVLQKKVE